MGERGGVKDLSAIEQAELTLMLIDVVLRVPLLAENCGWRPRNPLPVFILSQHSPVLTSPVLVGTVSSLHRNTHSSAGTEEGRAGSKPLPTQPESCRHGQGCLKDVALNVPHSTRGHREAPGVKFTCTKTLQTAFYAGTNQSV